MTYAEKIYNGGAYAGFNGNIVLITDFDHYVDDDSLFLINKEAEPKNIIFDYPHIGGDPFVSPYAIMLTFEFIKLISFSASYDIIKYSVLKILECINQKPKLKRPTLCLIVNDSKVILDCDFILNEKQKDKLIDAAIKSIIERI